MTSLPRLLMLSPVGLDAASWRGITIEGVEPMSYEFPGFGGRERSPANATIDRWVDELAAMLENTAGDPVHVVGCSLGGMVAQNLAVRHPDLVASMVLACTGAAGSAAASERADRTEQLGMAGVLDETLERWFTWTTLLANPLPPGVLYARDTLLALDPGAFADGWRVIATHDVLSRLTEIRIPVTCVAATQDSAAPLSRVEEMRDAIPGAQLVKLPGAHIVYLENPGGFSTVLNEHLSALI